jgi:hypothetical protein
MAARNRGQRSETPPFGIMQMFNHQRDTSNILAVIY